MDNFKWWESAPAFLREQTENIWIPLGNPGYSGANKQARKAALNTHFGVDGWTMGHHVRGQIVQVDEAIKEYEHSYRVYLQSHPEIVSFLTTNFGNVYDYAIENVYDDSYNQPHSVRNHYQDISIRRIIAELAEDEAWPEVIETNTDVCELVDLSDGSSHMLPRANGFQGNHLLEIRGPQSAGFFLNPAVVPFYDPTLIVSNPRSDSWYLDEGCAYWSIEAFWQFSKVLVVRYDRYLQLGDLKE